MGRLSGPQRRAARAERARLRELEKQRKIDEAAAQEAATAQKEQAEREANAKAAIRVEKSGKAKDWIKNNAGKTLKYPRDIFTSTTDYLAFDFYEFGPYLADGSRDDGTAGPKLGTIFTYMPSNIATGYQQNWGGAKLSPTGRVMMNAINQAAQGQDRDTVSGYLNKNLLAGSGKTVAADLFAKALNNTGSDNLSANALLGMQQGIGINNTIELFWSGHGGQRSTTVSINMAPRGKDETKEIESIIKTFKVAMHPSKNSTSAADVGGRFVEYPMAVHMRYMTKSKENPHLNKFKPMVVQSVATNFTPDNQYVVHEDGSPVAYNLQVNLKEIKLLYADDIIKSSDGGGLGY